MKNSGISMQSLMGTWELGKPWLQTTF